MVKINAASSVNGDFKNSNVVDIHIWALNLDDYYYREVVVYFWFFHVSQIQTGRWEASVSN